MKVSFDFGLAAIARVCKWATTLLYFSAPAGFSNATSFSDSSSEPSVWNYRDATFQEISGNQEISDKKKELQENWNIVSR